MHQKEILLLFFFLFIIAFSKSFGLQHPTGETKNVKKELRKAVDNYVQKGQSEGSVLVAQNVDTP